MKIILALVVSIVLIGGTIWLVNRGGAGSGDESSAGTATNVATMDGTQTITISAKGGYSPKITNAKADLPTVIKMDTSGTFDCSASLTIPSLNYRKSLPASGETAIDIPAQKAGSTLQGVCAMGMYSFTVKFS